MAEDTFSRLGLDPIEATEIMEMIGVYPADMVTPQNYAKLRDVVSFFQGKEDKRYLINKLVAGKPGIDKLDHLRGYISVRKEYEKKKAEMESLKAFKGALKDIKDEQMRSNIEDMLSNDIKKAKTQELKQLESELSLYER
jgi:hypothetical protein